MFALNTISLRARRISSGRMPARSLAFIVRTLSTGYVRGIDYSSHSFQINGSTQAVVTATGAGLPAMKQFFTLTESNSFIIRLVVEGTGLSANWIGPMVVDSVGGYGFSASRMITARCACPSTTTISSATTPSRSATPPSATRSLRFTTTPRATVGRRLAGARCLEDGRLFLRSEQQAQPDQHLWRRAVSVGCFAARQHHWELHQFADDVCRLP